MPKSTMRQKTEAAVLVPLDWLEERSGLVGYTKWFLFRNVPRDINWMQTLGAATLTAFIVQAVTGRDPRHVLQAGSRQGVRVDPEHHERADARLARARHAQVGCERLHHPHVPAHGAHVPVRRLQVPARAQLDRRRAAAGAGHARGLHRLPAAVGPDLVLGHRGRHQPERDRTVRGAVPGAVPPGRSRHRARHAVEVLRAAHARDPRRDHGADRPAPVPRRPPRRHVAAVVGRQGRP